MTTQETELASIERAYREGAITLKERNEQVLLLEATVRMAAVEAARLPYDTELEW
jgi:hypothetical protein